MWFVLKACVLLMGLNIGLFVALASVLQILKSRDKAKIKFVQGLRPQSGILSPLEVFLRILACIVGLAAATVMLALLRRHLAPLDNLMQQEALWLNTPVPESR